MRLGSGSEGWGWCGDTPVPRYVISVHSFVIRYCWRSFTSLVRVSKLDGRPLGLPCSRPFGGFCPDRNWKTSKLLTRAFCASRIFILTASGCLMSGRNGEGARVGSSSRFPNAGVKVTMSSHALNSHRVPRCSSALASCQRRLPFPH